MGLRSYDVNPLVVVSKESAFTKALTEEQFAYVIQPVPWWVKSKPLPFRKYRSLISNLDKSTNGIMRLIEENNIDFVYTNSLVSPIGKFAAFRKKVPHIWHLREFGDLDFSLNFMLPKGISKMIIRSSDAVICNSRAVMNHFFNHQRRNIHLIYNGSYTKNQFDFHLKKHHEEFSTINFLFAMVSYLSPNKGQESAIRAVAALKDKGIFVKLVLAGHGKKAYIDYLEKLVEELKVSDHIIFKGYVEDPFSIYYSCNCVLICSEHEALSRVGLEALSCGLPLIAKNSGGNPEIITSGETGLLYNSFDELVRNMEMLSQNPEIGQALGISGWRMAKEKFCIEEYAGNVYQIMESVVKERY